MRKLTRATAAFMVSSILGLQILGAGQVFAQSYNVLPPVIDKNGQKTIVDTLPQLNINQYNTQTPLTGRVATIPTGTAIEAIMNTSIGSAMNQVGDIFVATTTTPITIDGNVLIPEGSEVLGQITYVDGSGRLSKGGAMDVRFTQIKLPNGTKLPLTGKILTNDKTGTLKGGSLKKQIAIAVGTTTVATAAGSIAGLSVGSLIGAAGRGTLFGLSSGALVGIGYVIAKKGKEVSLPSGTKVMINLDQPLSISR